MRTRYAAALAAVALGAWPLAQEPAVPAFEVASIKPRTGEPGINASSSPDRFTHPDATLVDLIAFAHDVQGFQVVGGPDWIRTSRFAVSAKAATVPSQSGMRLMVGRLLGERFGLSTHGESRDLPFYALVQSRADGRLGERLTPSTIDCPALLEARAAATATVGPADGPNVCLWRIGFGPAGAMMTLDGAPLPRLARLLQPMLGRLVADQTGLTGTFDIQLEFAPEQTAATFPLASRPPADAAPRDGLSLFTALEEQLGLRLESRRGPVPVTVVDNATLPLPD